GIEGLLQAAAQEEATSRGHMRGRGLTDPHWLPTAAPASVAHQLVGGDRQITHALAGGMIDRVRDRGGGADNADLTDTLDTERIELVIHLLDENHIDRLQHRM